MNDNYQNQVDIGQALDWTDTITQDYGEYITLKPGEYEFTVTGLSRERYEGSDKLPPCPKAVITCSINSAQGSVEIRNNLFLTTKTEGLLSAFFTSIGQKKHGEPLRMDWTKVVGAKGRCKVSNREYNGNTYNDIERFLPPAENQKQSGGFAPGRF